MTNLEQAEKYWQELLSSPALTDETVQLVKANETQLYEAFSRSSFLANTILHKPQLLSDILAHQPSKEPLKHYKTRLSAVLQDTSNEDALFEALRKFRNQEMASITFFDVLNKQPIEESLKHVSALADTLVTGAYYWLYENLATRYGKPVGEDGDMHMYILGMGKLGGVNSTFHLIST